jgi:hypothetical protein
MHVKYNIVYCLFLIFLAAIYLPGFGQAGTVGKGM